MFFVFFPWGISLWGRQDQQTVNWLLVNLLPLKYIYGNACIFVILKATTRETDSKQKKSPKDRKNAILFMFTAAEYKEEKQNFSST